LIAVTVNGHTWRSRVALMRGQCLVGINAANRAASGISEGDSVEINLKLDTEPRVVRVPPDLAKVMKGQPEAKAAFDHLPYGLKRKYVVAIEEAKNSVASGEIWQVARTLVCFGSHAAKSRRQRSWRATMST
jgi:hypothetical protein